MSFEPTSFLAGKLADFILGLGKKTFDKSAEVTQFLREHGYTKLEDDFETLYVHALAMRRQQGTLSPVLKVFQRPEVAAAIRKAWQEGEVRAFDDEAKWAIEYFREGDEIRGLGVNVEDEVRGFYDTFRELVQEVRSPARMEDRRVLEEIRRAVVERPNLKVEVLPTSAQRFARNLGDWLTACGYVVSDPTWVDERAFDLVVERPHRRRPERYLIRGLDGEAKAGDFADLPGPEAHDVDESWLVASVAVSPAARQVAEAEGGAQGGDRLARTFDDLIDEEVDFGKYEAFLEREIEIRQLRELYVPLHCRRPEVDRQGEVRGETAIRGLQEHVDLWLEQPLAEHISVLGEFGMGKTWFCLRLADSQLSAWRDARASGRPRGRFPLLIQLRDYVSAPSIDSLLSDFFFNRFEARLPSLRAFEVLNRMGRFLLIFDGFDEMARRIDYQKVIDHFWELAKVVLPGRRRC